jgi:hypothetical protein
VRASILSRCAGFGVSEYADRLIQVSMEIKGLAIPVFSDGYFDDIVRNFVFVDCKSWPENLEKKHWGLMFDKKQPWVRLRRLKPCVNPKNNV